MIEQRLAWQSSLRQRLWNQEAQERARRQGEQDPEAELAGPPLVDDFGFYYPLPFLEMTISILEASHWNCWPDGYGWADQDDRLMQDVMLYLKLRDRARWEAEHGIRPERALIEPAPEKRFRLDQLYGGR